MWNSRLARATPPPDAPLDGADAAIHFQQRDQIGVEDDDEFDMLLKAPPPAYVFGQQPSDQPFQQHDVGVPTAVVSPLERLDDEPEEGRELPSPTGKEGQELLSPEEEEGREPPNVQNDFSLPLLVEPREIRPTLILSECTTDRFSESPAPNPSTTPREVDDNASSSVLLHPALLPKAKFREFGTDDEDVRQFILGEDKMVVAPVSEEGGAPAPDPSTAPESLVASEGSGLCVSKPPAGADTPPATSAVVEPLSGSSCYAIEHDSQGLGQTGETSKADQPVPVVENSAGLTAAPDPAIPISLEDSAHSRSRPPLPLLPPKTPSPAAATLIPKPPVSPSSRSPGLPTSVSDPFSTANIAFRLPTPAKETTFYLGKHPALMKAAPPMGSVPPLSLQALTRSANKGPPPTPIAQAHPSTLPKVERGFRAGSDPARFTSSPFLPSARSSAALEREPDTVDQVEQEVEIQSSQREQAESSFVSPIALPPPQRKEGVLPTPEEVKPPPPLQTTQLQPTELSVQPSLEKKAPSSLVFESKGSETSLPFIHESVKQVSEGLIKEEPGQEISNLVTYLSIGAKGDAYIYDGKNKRLINLKEATEMLEKLKKILKSWGGPLRSLSFNLVLHLVDSSINLLWDNVNQKKISRPLFEVEERPMTLFFWLLLRRLAITTRPPPFMPREDILGFFEDCATVLRGARKRDVISKEVDEKSQLEQLLWDSKEEARSRRHFLAPDPSDTAVGAFPLTQNVTPNDDSPVQAALECCKNVCLRRFTEAVALAVDRGLWGHAFAIAALTPEAEETLSRVHLTFSSTIDPSNGLPRNPTDISSPFQNPASNTASPSLSPLDHFWIEGAKTILTLSALNAISDQTALSQDAKTRLVMSSSDGVESSLPYRLSMLKLIGTHLGFDTEACIVWLNLMSLKLMKSEETFELGQCCLILSGWIPTINFGLISSNSPSVRFTAEDLSNETERKFKFDIYQFLLTRVYERLLSRSKPDATLPNLDVHRFLYARLLRLLDEEALADEYLLQVRGSLLQPLVNEEAPHFSQSKQTSLGQGFGVSSLLRTLLLKQTSP